MIITSISLRDWKHLKHVQLHELSPGVNVIHGPNRAGKSTIAQAVRIGLVDFDHSSSHGDVKALESWNGSDIPTLDIGFVVGGSRYRLNKRFSKNKGGGAEFYEAGESKPKAESKEATLAVQTLLGISKSNAGVGGLLWVQQGSADVPGVDTALGDALRKRLGVLITDGDSRFRDLLEDHLKRWFTTSGKDAKEVGELSLKIEAKSKAVIDLKNQASRANDLLAEHGSQKSALAVAESKVAESRKAIEGVEPRVKALEVRASQLKEIERKKSENANYQRAVSEDLKDLLTKKQNVEGTAKSSADARSALEPQKDAHH